MYHAKRKQRIGGGGGLYGIVTDVNRGAQGEERDGRVLIHTVIQKGDVQVGQTAWCRVAQNPQVGSFRGCGTVPGHKLIPGTKVSLQYDSDQSFVVEKAHPGEPRDITPHLDREKYKQENHEKKYPYVQNADHQKLDQQQALEADYGTVVATPDYGDAIEDIRKTIEHAQRYSGQRGLKSEVDKHTPDHWSNFPRQQGDLLNSVKAAKDLLGNKGEIIKKSFDMALEMQKGAKNGSPQSWDSMIGGSQNAAAGLASIQQMTQAASSQQQQKPQERKCADDPLFEELCALYTEETGQVCVDDQGRCTYEFEQWKKEKLREFNQEQGIA